MNYRHAFHAGNFADVIKHALLVLILSHLRRKETPFRVIDTHAGTGLYDLEAAAAERTGEWRDGVGRIEGPFPADVEALLAPYREILGKTRDRYGPAFYPGSPLIIRELLRPQDRAIVNEKHPSDGDLLAQCMSPERRVKVMRLDGWTALLALVPPPERRGLVVIDPPYEEPDELSKAAAHLGRAVQKWRTGIYALWYPVKAPGPVEAFAACLADRLAAPALRLELMVSAPSEGGGLAGSGMIVVNPPWTLAGHASLILPALAGRLARSGAGSYRIEQLGPAEELAPSGNAPARAEARRPPTAAELPRRTSGTRRRRRPAPP